MLHSQYNLLTLKGLEPSKTYLDKLPKDLVWYMLGYTGPQDGYVVIKKRSYGRGDIKLVKATTVHTFKELNERYSGTLHYGPHYLCEKVKFIYIDGKQYAAVPIRRKIEGFTLNNKPKKIKSRRCKGRTTTDMRCKRRTYNSNIYCTTHQEQIK